MNKYKKLISTLVLMPCLCFGQTTQVASDITKYLRCEQSSEISKEVLIFKLLMSSDILIREPRGDFNIFAGTIKSGTVSVYGLSPSRIAILSRQGSDEVLVGSLFSKDFPLKEMQILGAFQGGLKRKIDFNDWFSKGQKTLKAEKIMISSEPVSNDNFLVAGVLEGGEKFVTCAKKRIINEILR